MTYVNASDILEYGDFDSASVAVINSLVPRAQDVIEQIVGSTFFSPASDVSARNFTYQDDVEGLTLFLDEPLAAVTSIAVGGTAVTDYVTEPRNETPYWGITLKAGSSVGWGDYTDTDGFYEGAIVVTGQWGLTATVPAGVEMALIRLVMHFYKSRDTDPDFDRPVRFPDGTTILPGTIPQDVMDMLKPYIAPMVV